MKSISMYNKVERRIELSSSFYAIFKTVRTIEGKDAVTLQGVTEESSLLKAATTGFVIDTDGSVITEITHVPDFASEEGIAQCDATTMLEAWCALCEQEKLPVHTGAISVPDTVCIPSAKPKCAAPATVRAWLKKAGNKVTVSVGRFGLVFKLGSSSVKHIAAKSSARVF